MPGEGRGRLGPPAFAQIETLAPPDVRWGGFGAWIGGTAAIALLLLIGALALPRSPLPLTWFAPTTILLMAAAYTVVAALALLDAGCRIHGRSLPIGVVGVALASLCVARELSFPGVIHGVGWLNDQTAAILGKELVIGTPALLTAALVHRGGALRRPARAVLGAVGLGLGGGIALTVLGVLLAPVLPASIDGDGYTTFSRVLGGAALVPNITAVLLVALGVRGDRRVAPSIAGALTLLLLQELCAPFTGARYEPLWYVQNMLLLGSALVLLVGQFGLYRASVRAERERATESAVLLAVTRAMTGSSDPDGILASIPRLATSALEAVSGASETRCTLLEIEADWARIVAEDDPLGVVQVGATFPVTDLPVLGRLIAERRLQTCDLAAVGPVVGAVISRLGTRRGAYAPVIRGDAVVGALTLGLRSRRDFAPAELRLLEGLASVASLALTSRRGESLRQVQYAVARALSVADSLEEAASEVLAVLCEALGYQLGSLWVRDPRVEVLTRAQSWHAAGLDLDGFLAESDRLQVHPGQGLPGRVWVSGEAETVTDLSRRAGVARAATLNELGMRGATAVPIVVGGLCTGVLEIFSRRPQLESDEVLEVLVDVGRQLGQFMGRKRAEQALQESAERFAEMATTDRLTGLKNRREFEKVVGTIPRERFAILAIDVDGLKPINDQYGHEAGDVLLQAVAITLRSLVRGWDVVARVGGDEFAVILPGAGGAEAAAVAERMRTAMHSVTVLQGRARISVGWAAAPSGADPSATWRAADEVLYRAKRSGRDRVEGTEAAANGSTQPAATRDAVMLTEVLERGSIGVAYQPIVDLRDGTVIAYEALARPSGVGPLGSVAGIFDAARRLGRIRDLDWLCRRAALREARGLPAGATLFLNVSAAAFLDPVHEVDQLLLLLRWAGRSPTDVVLELTEQETIPDLDRLQLIAGAYREHGVRFAADDVGDGHSTLEVLAALGPEFIKIARSLSTTAARSGSRAAIRAAQAFARDSGSVLIAEGVESAAVARDLLELGITLGQGNHLGPPAAAPVAELVADPLAAS